MSRRVTVQPRNTAVFLAVRWDGNPDDPDIRWMAEQFGWKLGRPGMIRRTDGEAVGLVLYGRNGKRYNAKPGEWVIALGAGGSLRVCTDRQFKIDYKETGK